VGAAPTWDGFISPDDTAHIANVPTVGTVADGPRAAWYENGPMNDMVYAVRGGMEDWAASVRDPTAQCEPTTFGGYPKERLLNNSTLRALTALVETSNKRFPTS
jgi:hypothetical protein